MKILIPAKLVPAGSKQDVGIQRLMNWIAVCMGVTFSEQTFMSLLLTKWNEN